MPKSEADLMDDAALAGATFRMIGEKWVATVDAPCRFIAIGDTHESARAALAALLARFRAALSGETAKEPPVLANWIPVHELSEGETAIPYYSDTASEAIFSLRLTCTCGNDHHFKERGNSAVWVCPLCGRVYRAQARFSVEQHVGEAGGTQ